MIFRELFDFGIELSAAGTRDSQARVDSAVAASMKSPVSSISIACLRNTLRPSATLGVEQNSPTLIPDTATRAVCAGDRKIALRNQLATGCGCNSVYPSDHWLRKMQ